MFAGEERDDCEDGGQLKSAKPFERDERCQKFVDLVNGYGFLNLLGMRESPGWDSLHYWPVCEWEFRREVDFTSMNVLFNSARGQLHT